LKGTIERGTIHNPHFYEFQRSQNGGVAPRNAGDMRCGGNPDISAVRRSMIGKCSEEEMLVVMNAHQVAGHINIVVLPNYPVNAHAMDNTELRVDYLLNDITEKQWVSKLKQKMKKLEKNTDFRMVLEMFSTTTMDLIGNITESKENDISTIIVGLVELREYTNNSLRKIGACCGNIYPAITDKFEFRDNAHKEPKTRRRFNRFNRF
jgi:hypothetical protein